MKKLLYICLLLPLVALQSCKKAYSPGDNYDFSNSLPPSIYFAKATGSVALNADMVTPGSITVNPTLRTGLQQTVTVTYSISGAITQASTTITIAKEAYTAPILVVVPAKTAPGIAIVKIEKAVTADGKALTISADNVAANAVDKITITQN